MSGEHGNLKLYSFKPETSSMTVLFNKISAELCPSPFSYCMT